MDTPLAAHARAYAIKQPGITRIEGQTDDSRNIAGSSTVSEHSFGNALDIYGTGKGLGDLAAYFNANRTAFSIQVLCYDPGIGRTYDHCTTKHRDHIHVDFRPHCGGIVDPGGTASQRAEDCTKHQGGQVTFGGAGGGDEGGNQSRESGTFAPLAGVFDGVTAAIEGGLRTILIVGIGVIAIGAGVALLLKDTELGKTLKGAVTTVATKGVVK